MRDATIYMRTTQHEKTFLKKAAETAGYSNLTNFIMTTLRREADRILMDRQTTYLSTTDWALVNELIKNPPEPNQNLVELMSEDNKE